MHMFFSQERLLELAGIKGDGSNLLNESAQKNEFSSDDGATEEESCDEGQEDESKIRETIRAEIEHIWSSGEVFGRKARNNKGQVTVGFPGIGFKS